MESNNNKEKEHEIQPFKNIMTTEVKYPITGHVNYTILNGNIDNSVNDNQLVANQTKGQRYYQKKKLKLIHQPPELIEKRRQHRNEYLKKKRMIETAEQRERRLQKQRAHMKASRARRREQRRILGNMDPINITNYSVYCDNLSPDQSRKRTDRSRLYNRMKRMVETPLQREIRLRKNRDRMKRLRAKRKLDETVEERAERLRKHRERVRQFRQNVKNNIKVQIHPKSSVFDQFLYQPIIHSIDQQNNPVIVERIDRLNTFPCLEQTEVIDRPDRLPDDQSNRSQEVDIEFISDYELNIYS